MTLGQGRGLGELEGRLLSASRVGAYCAESAGEVVVLFGKLMQRRHHMVGSALSLWRQRLLVPESGWEGQPAFEVQLALVIPSQSPHHLNQRSQCIQE